MEPLPGISHPDLLKLVLSMAILLVTARLFAEIMVRIGQPAVVGEILAGVVLGPAILSGIFPALNDLLIPQTPVQGQLLDAIGLMGILLLILIVGMETDLALIRTRLKTATAVGLGGLIVPFGARARGNPRDVPVMRTGARRGGGPGCGMANPGTASGG